MKNRKRIFALGLAGVMLMSCLTGCAGAGASKKENANSKTDIEISYWNAGLGTAWLDALIADFEELHPEYHVYYTATADAAATSSALGLEDVDTVDLYMTLARRDAEILEPLDDVLDTMAEGDSKTIREKFNDGYLALLSRDG